MPTQYQFGPLTIVALEDGTGPFFQPREQAFPTATAEHWQLADALDPAATNAAGQWLEATDQLDLLGGETSLAAAVRVVPTPGHTPGHQSVLLANDGQEFAITGDVLVHAVQLVDPRLPYAHDHDPATAQQTRVRLLAELTGKGAVLATAHLGEPFLTPTAEGWLPPRR